MCAAQSAGRLAESVHHPLGTASGGGDEAVLVVLLPVHVRGQVGQAAKTPLAVDQLVFDALAPLQAREHHEPEQEHHQGSEGSRGHVEQASSVEIHQKRFERLADRGVEGEIRDPPVTVNAFETVAHASPDFDSTACPEYLGWNRGERRAQRLSKLRPAQQRGVVRAPDPDEAIRSQIQLFIDTGEGLRRHRQNHHARKSSLSVEDGPRELDRDLAGNTAPHGVADVELIRAAAAMNLEVLPVAEKDALIRLSQIRVGEPAVGTDHRDLHGEDVLAQLLLDRHGLRKTFRVPGQGDAQALQQEVGRPRVRREVLGDGAGQVLSVLGRRAQRGLALADDLVCGGAPNGHHDDGDGRYHLDAELADGCRVH